jgi:hypothetical protein
MKLLNTAPAYGILQTPKEVRKSMHSVTIMMCSSLQKSGFPDSLQTLSTLAAAQQNMMGTVHTQRRK